MATELIKGRVWKFGDDISTDLMMPGFAVYTRPGITPQEAAKYCMYSNRPDWASQVQAGDILVAGENFGCGSGRPVARILIALGISLILAESVGRVFFRNSINLGLPVVTCKGVQAAFSEGDIAEVDLPSGEVINKTTGQILKTELLPPDSPPMQILRAGGLMALLEKEYLTK